MPKVVPEYKRAARARILEAAQTLFLRHGFRETTMDALAAELGVSKGALYLYFRSKGDLLRALQSINQRAAYERLERAADAPDFPKALTAAVFHTVEDATALASFWPELLAAARRDTSVQRALLDDSRKDAQVLRRILTRLQREGRVPADRNVDSLAFAVIALCESAVGRILLGTSYAVERRRLLAALRLVLGP